MDLGQNWTALMPRHARLLQDLRKQLESDRKRMVTGAAAGWLGWGGLKDPDERFPDKVLFDPLLERWMIEKGTEYRPAGHLFVRATAFGILCLDLGLQPKHPMRAAAELKALTKEAETVIADRDKARTGGVVVEGKTVSPMSNSALQARIAVLEEIVLMLAGDIEDGTTVGSGLRQDVAKRLGRIIAPQPAAPKKAAKKGAKRS